MKDLANQYLTVSDVARRWQIGAATVRKMIRDKQLPSVHLHREHRIRAGEMWSCEQGPFPRGAAQARQLGPLMTVCDVAVALRVAVRTVERCIEDGLPTRNVGANVLIDEAAARTWLIACRGIVLPPFVVPEKRRRRSDVSRAEGTAG